MTTRTSYRALLAEGRTLGHAVTYWGNTEDGYAWQCVCGERGGTVTRWAEAFDRTMEAHEHLTRMAEDGIAYTPEPTDLADDCPCPGIFKRVAYCPDCPYRTTTD